MRRRLTRKLLLVRGLVLAGATVMVALAGCSDQGEGERCALFSGQDASVNGSSECASGLTCQPPRNFKNVTQITNPVGGTLGICCPPMGQPVTSFNCQVTGGGGPEGPIDASFDAVFIDAPADAPQDGAAKLDAPHDAAHAEAAKDAAHKDAPHDAPRDTTGNTADAGRDATMGAPDSSAKDAAADAPPKDAADGG